MPRPPRVTRGRPSRRQPAPARCRSAPRGSARQQAQRGLDPLRIVCCSLGQLVHGERLRRDHEQRLERARERVERVGGDQAERAVHAATSFADGPHARHADRRERRGLLDRDLPGAAQLEERQERDGLLDARRAPRPPGRSRSATGAEQRAEPLEELRTGGKRSSRCASETCGGSAASARSNAASAAGSCGASRRSPFGASGAGPSRKNRSRSAASRSPSHAAALLDPPVLLEPPRELLGGLLRLQLLELAVLAGEQAARLQLQQRRHEHEELAARVEIELFALGKALDEGKHDAGHVHLAQRQLLPQNQRQQQVERALERVEVELELADDHQRES